MYESYFNFTQAPFSIAPDPAFLYLSDGHREALAHLLYGFSHGGFVLLTGEVGTGKTTLLRNLIKQTPESLDVAFILNPRLTVKELLETICDELGIPYLQDDSLSVKQYIDLLNRHLLKSHKMGRDTVVIIDEAQNLSPAVLEQIRLLTNLETDKRKLLRIILLGQPELGELLARKELRQLAQRITARYHLGTLTREDTYAYVIHRLSRAGGNPHTFTRSGLWRLYKISNGTPRIINLVADRALLGAYVEGKHRVGARLVNRAAREVLGKPAQPVRWIATGILAACAAGVAWAFFGLPENSATGSGSTAAPTASIETQPDTEWRKVERINPEQQSPADAMNNSQAASGQKRAEEPAPFGKPEDALADSVESEISGVPTLTVLRPEPEKSTQDTSELIKQRPIKLRRPDVSNERSRRLAYASVFEQWGADYSETDTDTIPCDFAPSAGLQCLSRNGSWSDIRALNLPVVLELLDENNEPFYGAVTALKDDIMTLHLGDDVFQVTSADLRDIWFGGFVVLWQMPPYYQGSLKRGDQHRSIAWLRRQLESLSSKDIPGSDETLFDAELYRAVLDFQSQEQLLADGVVGPATWIRLASRLALPSPKLAASTDG